MRPSYHCAGLTFWNPDSRGPGIFLEPGVCDHHVGSKRAEYYIAELSLGVMLDGCQYGAGNWPLLKGFLQRGASRALKGVSQALYSLNFARAGIYYFFATLFSSILPVAPQRGLTK